MVGSLPPGHGRRERQRRPCKHGAATPSGAYYPKAISIHEPIRRRLNPCKMSLCPSGCRNWPCRAAPDSCRSPMRQPERSEEHTSELQSHLNLVCRLLLEKKKNTITHDEIDFAI